MAEQRGASESSLIASLAAEKSDRAQTLTSTTTDDAAVDTEIKVDGLRELPDWFRGGGDGGAKE